MSFLSKLFGSSSGGVKFVRTYTQGKEAMGIPIKCIYEMYKSDSSLEAREFLENKEVKKEAWDESCHVVVETPEGNWAKDKNGIYKEG